MDIKQEAPPNYQSILKVFPQVKNNKGVIFTYGNTIYCPFKQEKIPEWIVKHEEVHAERQYIQGVDDWWNQYLEDVKFRYEEELLAHQREYQVYCAFAKSRTERRLGLKSIAQRLSSDLYGNCVRFAKAKEAIKNVEED